MIEDHARIGLLDADLLATHGGILVVVAGTLAVVHTNAAAAGPEQRDRRCAAAARRRARPPASRCDRVLEQRWRTTSPFAEDQFLTFKGQRALAMMHLAMHDALNAIVPVYEAYAYAGGPRLAHPIAATSQAAHDVLARAVSRPAGSSSGISSPAGLHTSRTARCATAGLRLARPLRQRSSRCARATAGISPAPTSSATGRAGIKRRRRGTASWRNRDFGSRSHSSSRLRAAVPAASAAAVAKRGICPRVPRSQGAGRSRQHASDGRADRAMPSGGWSSPKGRSIASRGNWRRIAICISGRRPVCLRTSAWRSTTRMSRPGTRNTPTTIGVRTRRFGRRTPTRTRARRPTRAGSRCVRRRRFPSTCRLTLLPCGASFGVLQQTFGDRVLVHDGDDDRATGHADTNVRQLPCGGGRVCGLAGAAGLAFPLLRPTRDSRSGGRSRATR